MPYDWLLFDADHTLFDFDAAEARAFAATLREQGHEPASDHLAIYRDASNACWDQYARGAISSTALRTERFVQWVARSGVAADPIEMSQRYLPHLARGTDLIEGAESLLQLLSTRCQLALITNGLSDVQRPRLAASTIGHHFDVVVVSDEEGVAKPQLGLFDIAFERMQDPGKHEVLMIGDSLTSDMRGGIDYGIDTCWFNPMGHTRPADMPITREIAHLNELARLFRSVD